MNCWHCGTELIWGGDHDLDDYEDTEYDIITNLTCPKCESYVEVYHKIENKLCPFYLVHQSILCLAHGLNVMQSYLITMLILILL